MSAISKHNRKTLKKLCKLLQRSEDIVTKEVLMLRGTTRSDPTAEAARLKLIEKHEGMIGRMMFIREETEELLEDLPDPRRRSRGQQIGVVRVR